MKVKGLCLKIAKKEFIQELQEAYALVDKLNKTFANYAVFKIEEVYEEETTEHMLAIYAKLAKDPDTEYDYIDRLLEIEVEAVKKNGNYELSVKVGNLPFILCSTVDSTYHFIEQRLQWGLYNVFHDKKVSALLKDTTVKKIENKVIDLLKKKLENIR